MNNKIELRTKAKALRKTLNIHLISEKAVELVRNYDIYKSSKHVMLFYPTKYEIDLRELLNDDKNFYLPRVNKKQLDVCQYKQGDELKKSEFNIYEPVSKPIDTDIIELVIVPALVADNQNYRLGYGGGFYDRFMKGKNFSTLSVVPKELYMENLPAEEYDIPVDKVFFI